MDDDEEADEVEDCLEDDLRIGRGGIERGEDIVKLRSSSFGMEKLRWTERGFMLNWRETQERAKRDEAGQSNANQMSIPRLGPFAPQIPTLYRATPSVAFLSLCTASHWAQLTISSNPIQQKRVVTLSISALVSLPPVHCSYQFVPTTVLHPRSTLYSQVFLMA